MRQNPDSHQPSDMYQLPATTMLELPHYSDRQMKLHMKPEPPTDIKPMHPVAPYYLPKECPSKVPFCSHPVFTQYGCSSVTGSCISFQAKTPVWHRLKGSHYAKRVTHYYTPALPFPRNYPFV
jgi:hypothetical protein